MDSRDMNTIPGKFFFITISIILSLVGAIYYQTLESIKEVNARQSSDINDIKQTQRTLSDVNVSLKELIGRMDERLKIIERK